MKYKILFYLLLTFTIVFGDNLCKIKQENGLCYICQEGAVLNDQAKCQCKQGLTLISDKNKCEQIICPVGCNKCKSSSECIECLEGAELNQGKCECDEGYTINTELNKCEKIKCPTACEICKSQTECIQCIENTFHKQNECKCLEGYSINSAQNKCDKINCPFGCNKCISESKCIECSEGTELNQGKCQCKEGYKTTSGLNYCFELICPIGCKTCTTTTDCSECQQQSKFNQEYNNCQCIKDLVNVDFVNECINTNKVIEQNFLYNQKKIYNSSFEFCKGTFFNQTLLDQDIALIFSDDSRQYLKGRMKRIGLNAQVSIIALWDRQMRGQLYYNYEIFSPGKYRREMKDVSFTISTEQGSVRNSLDRYVGFDIRDPESLYHFNLIINCGNVVELSYEQINQLLDNYFGLFYVCPPNCKDCTFEGEIVTCQKCIDQFYLTDDGKCKFKYPYNKCEQPYYPSQNNTCIKVVNDELLICSNNDKCYNCLDQRNEINFMDTDSCTCKKGYYLDQRKLQCLECDELCEECQFRKSYCQKCKVNAYLDQETNMCKECIIRNCQQCESNTICKDCQSEYYLDNQNSSCTKCEIQNCKNCQNEKQCIQAESGYYVEEDKIKQCSISNCSICDSSTCKVCKEEFIINTQTNTCEKCNVGCRICKLDSQKLCTSCKSGYYLDRIYDLQCKPCIKNCVDCYHATQCHKCVDGITLKNSVCQCEENEFYDAQRKQCVKCSNNCIECENQEKCNLCETGYFINNKKQCQQCLTDCETCKDDKKCSKCLDGKIMSKDRDKCSCMDGCQECSLIEEDDTKEYEKIEYFDKKKKDAKQKEICTKSFMGYYLEEQKALKCEKGCKVCITKDNCIACGEGYLKEKDENKCQKCSDNCSICDDQLKCIICRTGYYLKDNKCNKCDNCLECKYENQKIKCFNCKESMYLEAGKCIEGNCKNPVKNGKCDICNDGYYLDNSKCIKCKENCLMCDKNQCRKCEYSYYERGPLCLNCPDFCTNCQLEKNLVRCYSCEKDYQLNSQQKCEKNTSPVLILSLIALIPFACLSYYLCNRKQKFVLNQSQEPRVQELTDQTENELELPTSEQRSHSLE